MINDTFIAPCLIFCFLVISIVCYWRRKEDADIKDKEQKEKLDELINSCYKIMNNEKDFETCKLNLTRILSDYQNNK